MDINFELYKVFYHTASLLSFSEAAAELFISPSAVSQSIKVLEKQLGQSLFSRSTKKVSLTKEGEMLFKHIEPAVQLILRGENQISGFGQSKSMQLRIAASDTICRYYLVPFLKNFHRQYQEIHIRIINGTALHCAELLQTNQVDVIITNSPNPSLGSSMHIEPLKTFQDVFVYHPDFIPITGNTASFAELSKHPIMMLGKRSATSSFLHGQFQKHSIELAPSIELSSNDLLIDFAEIGLGIAFVPDFCITENSGRNLKVIRTKEKIPKRKLVAAYDDNIELSEAAGFFVEQLITARTEQ